ncbi:MAG: hypothetical protein IKN30_01610, partial [Synergistaceae bacterium]|nr:hypothetical protein [Synergistaceae bacterium]
GYVNKGLACIAEGKMDDRGQMILDRLTKYDELDGAQRYINIPVDINQEKLNMKEFVQNLRSHKGNAKVILELKDEDESCRICLNGVSVDPELVRSDGLGIRN